MLVQRYASEFWKGMFRDAKVMSDDARWMDVAHRPLPSSFRRARLFYVKSPRFDVPLPPPVLFSRVFFFFFFYFFVFFFFYFLVSLVNPEIHTHDESEKKAPYSLAYGRKWYAAYRAGGSLGWEWEGVFIRYNNGPRDAHVGSYEKLRNNEGTS